MLKRICSTVVSPPSTPRSQSAPLFPFVLSSAEWSTKVLINSAALFNKKQHILLLNESALIFHQIGRFVKLSSECNHENKVLLIGPSDLVLLLISESGNKVLLSFSFIP